MRRIKIGLLGRILIAIVLGVLLGRFLPSWLIRVFITFNGLFSEFLNFIVPLIIVGFVTPAIADIGAKAGRMLLITTVIAYVTTLISGFISYFTGAALFPSLISGNVSIDQISDSINLTPYFTISIPAMLNVMTALVLSFMLGLGIANLGLPTLKNVFADFKEIVLKTIYKVVLPLLPIYIFGIFLNMTHSGQVMKVLSVFFVIIGIIFALHVFVLVFQYVSK